MIACGLQKQFENLVRYLDIAYPPELESLGATRSALVSSGLLALHIETMVCSIFHACASVLCTGLPGKMQGNVYCGLLLGYSSPSAWQTGQVPLLQKYGIKHKTR